jgi:hypothetical protein
MADGLETFLPCSMWKMVFEEAEASMCAGLRTATVKDFRVIRTGSSCAWIATTHASGMKAYQQKIYENRQRSVLQRLWL